MTLCPQHRLLVGVPSLLVAACNAGCMRVHAFQAAVARPAMCCSLLVVRLMPPRTGTLPIHSLDCFTMLPLPPPFVSPQTEFPYHSLLLQLYKFVTKAKVALPALLKVRCAAWGAVCARGRTAPAVCCGRFVPPRLPAASSRKQPVRAPLDSQGARTDLFFLSNTQRVLSQPHAFHPYAFVLPQTVEADLLSGRYQPGVGGVAGAPAAAAPAVAPPSPPRRTPAGLPSPQRAAVPSPARQPRGASLQGLAAAAAEEAEEDGHMMVEDEGGFESPLRQQQQQQR